MLRKTFADFVFFVPFVLNFQPRTSACGAFREGGEEEDWRAELSPVPTLKAIENGFADIENFSPYPIFNVPEGAFITFNVDFSPAQLCASALKTPRTFSLWDSASMGRSHYGIGSQKLKALSSKL